MTALADSPAAWQDRRAYPGPGGANTDPDTVPGPVLRTDRSEAVRDRVRTVRSWPLMLLAFPAATEVWSGWVGIAQRPGSAWSPRCSASGPRCTWTRRSRSRSASRRTRPTRCAATPPPGTCRTTGTAGTPNQPTSGPQDGPPGTSPRACRPAQQDQPAPPRAWLPVPRARRTCRPCASPTNWPPPGNPCRGGHCATAGSRVEREPGHARPPAHTRTSEPVPRRPVGSQGRASSKAAARSATADHPAIHGPGGSRGDPLTRFTTVRSSCSPQAGQAANA